MKYSDVKINSILVSPSGGEWKVIKKYASDMWLIKKNDKEKLICILTGGQVRRNWRVKE